MNHTHGAQLEWVVVEMVEWTGAADAAGLVVAVSLSLSTRSHRVLHKQINASQFFFKKKSTNFI